MPDSTIVIRPEAPGDEAAIDAVVSAAFLQQFGSVPATSSGKAMTKMLLKSSGVVESGVRWIPFIP